MPLDSSTPRLLHRPAGDGHPYAASPDQRAPVRPSADDGVVLGVRAPGSGAVTCTLVSPSGAETEHRLVRGPADVTDAAALAGGDGHLAAAQAATAATGDVWHLRLPALREPGRWRYRFETVDDDAAGPATSSSTSCSEWFDLPVGTWGEAPAAALRINGAPAATHPRLAPGSVGWYADDDGVWRVRLGLRLAPGEHVVGFGERFEAVDLRGRTLDAVVFEQYKSQGVHGRTYLPMPFAHVLGGDGWGFHVRTSRRTWFDVGASDPDVLWVETALDGSTEPSSTSTSGTAR